MPWSCQCWGGLIELLPQTRAGRHDVGGRTGGKEQEVEVIIDNPGMINDLYKIGRLLGSGSSAKVSHALQNSTGKAFAVKTYDRRSFGKPGMAREISILKRLDHPNVIVLHETFRDSDHVYLVLDLCVGGELFDRITDAGHFQEAQAAILMRQLLEAIQYCHSNLVCHRCPKPEDLLLETRGRIEDSILKLIDFEMACTFEPGRPMTTKTGTPYYTAPQVLVGSYDESCALWSCGVIMYVLLCGYPPFYGETDVEVLSKVRLGNYSFNAADWKNISEDAKNLVRMLLKMNPQDRYRPEQALAGTWIETFAPPRDVVVAIVHSAVATEPSGPLTVYVGTLDGNTQKVDLGLSASVAEALRQIKVELSVDTALCLMGPSGVAFEHSQLLRLALLNEKLLV